MSDGPPHTRRRAELPPRDAPWDSTDAWVLASIAQGAPRSVDLRGLLATADYLNHAVPGAAELTRALRRLARAGLVYSRGTRYRVTVPVLRFLDTRSGARGTRLLGEARTFLESYRPTSRERARVVPVHEESAVRAAYP